MKKEINYKNNVLGFSLLLLIIGVAIYIVISAINAFNGFGDQLKASVIQVTGIISVAIITFVANKSIEKKRAFEASLREEKVKMYDEYIKFYFRVFSGDKVGNKPSNKEMMDFFAKTNPILVTYASNSVLEKIGKMKSQLSGNPESLFVMENVLLAMRKDLGHSRHGFKKGDILRLFINDIDNYLPNNSSKVNEKNIKK